MASLFDRAGMSTATSGTGALALAAALGAVAPNLCGFLSFANAGVGDQNVVSYLILDANGNWESGWGVYTASGPTLTRNPVRSSNANAAISLSGNAQVFVTARAEDLAPKEALAANNLAVNGAMDISQENGTNVVSVSSGLKYIIDGWSMSAQGSAVCVGQQSQVSATVTGLNLPNSLVMKATTGNGGTIGTSDYAEVFTPIEGYRFARCSFGQANAQALTIGFWINCSVAGTFGVSLRNSALNRSYVANVTFSNPATWEWHTVTIPGDTAGTWLSTNGVGAYLSLVFVYGTGQQGAANTRLASNTFATSSQSNFFATNNNLIAITGVVVLPGAHQISQEQAANLLRPLPDELAICQRYYEKTYDLASLPGNTALNGCDVAFASGLPSSTYTWSVSAKFKVRKRAVPTITMYATDSGTSGKVRDRGLNVDLTANTGDIGEAGFLWYTTQSVAQTQLALTAHWVADARL